MYFDFMITRTDDGQILVQGHGRSAVVESVEAAFEWASANDVDREA